MAHVLLVTTGDNQTVPNSRDDYDRLVWAAQRDRFKVHRLCDDPEEADIILFVGSREFDFWDVRRHPLARAFREKSFLYHTADRVMPFLPGVFPSLRQQDNHGNRSRSAPYLNPFQMSDILAENIGAQCDILFSFCGSAETHPVRRQVMSLNHSRSYIQDTSALLNSHTGGPWAPGPHRAIYADNIRRSKFILCPRGRGPSTWRIYETLKGGRVPVIISDDWIPPMGPSWDSISLRVPERACGQIPELLENMESDARAMGILAARAWDNWFSDRAIFNSVVEACTNILSERKMPEKLGRLLVCRSLVRPKNFQRFVLARLKRYVV